jgi:hypothetical protein
MVSPVPSREPDPQDPPDQLEGDPIDELSNLFQDAQTVERVDDLSIQRSAPGPVYREPAPEPSPEPEDEPPPASVTEVTEAIFAESAALAMNEIADRLDAIERSVAERLVAFDRVASERLATLDRAAKGMTFPDELRSGLAKLERIGELAGRVDGTEARIRANAERTIEALRSLNARFEGRMEELGARIESLEGSLERLRQGVEAVAAYVRRVREGVDPSDPSQPTSPEARQVMERVWREPT